MEDKKKKRRRRKWKERRKKTANYSFIKYTHQVCVWFHKDKINIQCFLSVVSLLCCFRCSVANLCLFFVTSWIAACQAGLDHWVGKISWRRAWQPTPVFLPRESPQIEEPGGPQSMGSQRFRHDWATKHSTVALRVSYKWKWPDSVRSSC